MIDDGILMMVRGCGVDEMRLECGVKMRLAEIVVWDMSRWLQRPFGGLERARLWLISNQEQVLYCT